MKKIYVAVITILLLVIPFGVYAEEYNFRGLTVSFNDEWDVFTKENISGNAKLKEYGTTEEFMLDMFEKQNVYCEAILEDLDDQKDTLDGYIQIFSLGSQKINYNDLDDEEIIKSGKSLSEGTTVDNIDAVTIGNNKYATFEYETNIESNGVTGTFNVLQYYTIQDGVLYSFKFQKYNPISYEDKAYVKEVLETASIYRSYKPSWLSKALAAGLIAAICSIAEAINISRKKKKNNKQEDENPDTDSNNDKKTNNIETEVEEETFKCDNCGAKVSEDADKCPKCGATFVDELKELNEVDEEETFVCSNCGTVISNSENKCPNCGEKFDDDNQEDEKQKGKRKSKSNVDQKYSDLNKLKKLLDKDIITKEEFEKEKKKILNGK